ncbi:AbrB family transcriptional regulator [Salipiger sp. H15]|uniref:AbrB family transcriptional regulator n=1 Tax=Alloyangia sp. H15 TaxID=3029062 RepID=A0AAU8AF39_9RHOB
MSLSTLSLRMIFTTACLLLAGGAGGWIAQHAHLPMPYMLGSLFTSGLAVALFQTRGLADYAYPMKFRTLFIGLIGVMIGTQVSPEVFALLPDLPLTLSALLVFVLLCQAGNFLIFHRLGGYDRATAFYAGAPGGLMESLVLGEKSGADLRLLTAQQFLRIILVIAILPSALSLWIGHPVGSAAGQSVMPTAPASAGELLVVVLATLAGLFAASKIKLPAGQITGPLLLSAALTLSGLVDMHLPFWLIAAAQVVVGSSLGVRFTGMTGAMLRRSAGLSLLSVGWMLALGAAFALALTAATEIPFLHLMISYAPGGVTEMSIIALSLAANPALVSLHHVVRILLTVGIMVIAEKRLPLGQPGE